ncbi:hypothetical protein [Methyloprofundus sedimenti]|uniref:hypothetical protein n=1 Tax=Methyloprofundus sedimenti TaxID=1420851 RepID=UPI001E480AC6|nr:hypothetical protein [Methyloprofundus sedimenti]
MTVKLFFFPQNNAHHEGQEDNEVKGIRFFNFKSFMRFMVKPNFFFPCVSGGAYQ